MDASRRMAARESPALHSDHWQRAAAPGIPRRRIYDTRTALALRAFGVTEFATANVKDFEGCGFVKVWNPIEHHSRADDLKWKSHAMKTPTSNPSSRVCVG